MHSLLQLYNDWVGRIPAEQHCIACKARASVCYEQEALHNRYCGDRCQQHYHTLLGVKRLLEADEPPVDLDLWDRLSPEMVVALLEVTFPLRETDKRQFSALGRFRATNERYRQLIDDMIYPQMRRLPRAFERKLTDETLAPFVRLERLYLAHPTRVSNDAIARQTSLTRLKLTQKPLQKVDTITIETLKRLPRLTRLSLANYRIFPSGPLEPFRPSGPLDNRWPASLTALRIYTDLWIPALTENITSLSGLRSLKLENVEHVTGATLAQMTQLTRLSIERFALNARIMRYDDATLATLTNLTDLTLHLTLVTGRGLQSLTGLRRLALRENDGVSDTQLAELVNLQHLKLGASEDITGEAFASLPQLTRLSLRATRVTNASLTALGGQLRRLTLGHNGLINDRGLTGHSSLEVLRLHGGISQEGLRGGLVSLRHLNVRHDEHLHATDFIRAYEWLPSLRHLNLVQSDVEARAELYLVYTANDDTQPRLLQDHLPVGCFVRDTKTYAFRVVGRVDGAAQIVPFHRREDIVATDGGGVM